MAYLKVGEENSADINLYYKDWGSGQPVVFSHGWPLSADAFEDQMIFLAERGYKGSDQCGSACVHQGREISVGVTAGGSQREEVMVMQKRLDYSKAAPGSVQAMYKLLAIAFRSEAGTYQSNLHGK